MVHKDSQKNISFRKKVVKYGLQLAELIPGLDKPATMIKYLREFHDEQKKIRISRYCTALVNSISIEDHTTANELATDIEFADLLQACVNDSDSNKADAYAQLTIALKFGALEKEYRRHFMLSLKQLPHEDLELLRLSYIAKKNELIPARGYAPLSQSDIFDHRNLGVIRSLSVEVLRQLGMIKSEGITDLGKSFVESIYKREFLENHEDFKMWQSPPIIILTGKSKDSYIDSIIDNFKSLRIRCVAIPILNFMTGVENNRPYKAIIFAGNYEGLTYGNQRELVDFTTANPQQCINLGYKLSNTANGMCSRHIDFNGVQTVAEKVLKVAKVLEFIVNE